MSYLGLENKSVNGHNVSVLCWGQISGWYQELGRLHIRKCRKFSARGRRQRSRPEGKNSILPNLLLPLYSHCHDITSTRVIFHSSPSALAPLLPFLITSQILWLLSVFIIMSATPLPLLLSRHWFTCPHTTTSHYFLLASSRRFIS